jgi:molybdopterin synthase sulfur carrier subunit
MPGSTIELRIYASLRKWKKQPILSLELHRPCSVRELLEEAGIPHDEVAIIILDGKRARLESTLTGGEVLSLFPLIGGG